MIAQFNSAFATFRDRGSSTVMVLAALAVIAAFGATAATAGAVAGAAAQVQGAADAAALAAAHQARDERALGGHTDGSACEVAAAVIAANRATLTSCSVTQHGVVVVEVSTPVAGWAGPLRVSRAAVAGPRFAQP